MNTRDYPILHLDTYQSVHKIMYFQFSSLLWIRVFVRFVVFSVWCFVILTSNWINAACVWVFSFFIGRGVFLFFFFFAFLNNVYIVFVFFCFGFGFLVLVFVLFLLFFFCCLFFYQIYLLFKK